MTLRRIWQSVAAVSTVAGLVALWFIPAWARGWLGVPSDPLAALPALLVGLPWTALAGLLPDAGMPWMPMLLLVGSVILNALLLWWLARRRAAPKGPGR